MSSYSILYSAVVSSTASTGSAGDVLIPDATTGEYVKATTANRGTRRATGIALTSYVAGGTVNIQQYGQVDTAITGFAAATASWVRCSTTGTLEKVTPGSGDDLLGKVDTDGRLFLDPGKWDSSNYAGGGGGGDPAMGGDVSGTASAATVAKVNGATVPASGALTTGNAAYVSGVSALTYSALNLAGGAGWVTGTLPVASGGTGITSLGTGVAAWLGATLPTFPASGLIVGESDTQTLTGKTIAGASNTLTVRLASDVSGTLPVANGGTGLSAIGTAYQTVRVNAGATALEFGAVDLSTAGVTGVLPTANVATTLTGKTLTTATIDGSLNTISNIALASQVTGTLPVANGGTGLTALGTALYVLRVNAGATALEFAAASGGASPNGSSGDIMTSNGASDFGTAITPAAGIATWLATPSSANLATAVTGETGTGALVFGTSPTLSNPVVTIATITNSTSGGTINDCTLSGTSGFVRRVRFTDATGPTITGFDASGVADGTILRVLAVAATISMTNEGAGSAAANRITLAFGTTVNLSAGTFTQFEYDATASRWRHIAATAI